MSAHYNLSETAELLDMCSSLDPAFKTSYLENKEVKKITVYCTLALKDTSNDPLVWWKLNSDRFPLLSMLHIHTYASVELVYSQNECSALMDAS